MSRVNLDELTRESRNFYERALMKFSGSLFFASVAFMFIGFAAQSGGLANAYNQAADKKFNLVPFASGTTSEIKDANTSAASGYGFACFVYLLGFILASAMSWFMSPYYGTKRESQMLKAPSDLEGTTPSQQASIPVAAAVGVDASASSQSHASLYDGYPKTS